jgi:hypothetical protein
VVGVLRNKNSKYKITTRLSVTTWTCPSHSREILKASEPPRSLAKTKKHLLAQEEENTNEDFINTNYHMHNGRSNNKIKSTDAIGSIFISRKASICNERVILPKGYDRARTRFRSIFFTSRCAG